MNMEHTPKYPAVHVQLTGQDGNAMMIIGSVRKELRRAGVRDLPEALLA
jgi:hypothetical protein